MVEIDVGLSIGVWARISGVNEEMINALGGWVMREINKMCVMDSEFIQSYRNLIVN